MNPDEEIRERLKHIPDPRGLLEGIFAHAPVGFQIYTPEGHSVLTNQAFRDMFGSEPPPEYNILEDEIARERGLLDLVHRAFRGETIHTPPIWYDPRDLRQVHVAEGRRVAMETTFFPLMSREGKIEYVAIIFKDVTAEHLAKESAEAQQRKAEEAERWARLLAEAGAILVDSLDHAATLRRVAHLMVPALADFCIIDVIEGDSWRRIAVAHADSQKERLLEELQQRYPARSDSPQPAARVVRSGQPEMLNQIFPEILASHTTDEEHRALMGRLEMGCHLAVPLQTHGRTLGALSLGRGPARPKFTPADVDLASELGRRMASAVELAHLYQEAQEAIRARDEFLSIASHELKTPLTPLQLQIEMLQVGLKSEGEQLPRRVAQMRRQTERLSRLVESLLDVSRISVGRLRLERERLDLSQLVSDVAERFREQATRANCPLTVRAGGPVIGCWDRLRLEQVVSNLLSNALKYGPGGPVELGVEAISGMACLTVSDSGQGISPTDIGRIFERFERAAAANDGGGLGLGLYITRQLVEAHGGSINVKSALGSGSVFSVELPLPDLPSRMDK